MAEGTRDGEPLLRVTAGSPTKEELAALVAVLVSRAAGRRAAAVGETSQWVRSARPGAGLPALQVRGPAAWRAAGLPAAR